MIAFRVSLILLVLFSLSLSQNVYLNLTRRGEIHEATGNLNVRAEPCTGQVITTLKPRTQVKYEGLSITKCDLTWWRISGSFGSGWASSKWLALLDTGEVNLDVPMIHQVWDVGDSFKGNWACGPTSATMAVAYYGKLEKKPIKCSKPYEHYNDYGWYVSNKYTSPTGFVFDRSEKDSNGTLAQGAYGHCVEDGMAWAWRIQSFCSKHGLKTSFHDKIYFHEIQQALNSNQLVILSTNIIGYKHLFLVKGYKGTTTIYANDPFGDAKQQGYGTKMNGANVAYNFEWVVPKWMVIIGE
jgi:hypothetical protein